MNATVLTYLGLVTLASVIGGFIPSGPSVSFPVVVVLLQAGAGFPQVVAFLTAWSIVALHRVLIYEIPLLVETGAAEKFDYVITVESDIELRKARLLKKGLYISQIEKRMASQASEEARTAVADSVIRNDGDEDSLLRQVENLWESVLVPQSLG